MKKDLSEYTREELEAELARRDALEAQTAGKDWYFMAVNDDGRRFVAIVHRRFWHRHHHIKDCHLGKMVDVPKGFDEVAESHFEYPGSLREARRALKAMGFIEIQWRQRLVVRTYRIGDARVRVDCVCDTDALERVLDAVKDSRLMFDDIGEYRAWIESLVPDTVCEIVSRPPHDRFVDLCWMKRRVAESLPPYPDGFQE